MPSNHETAIPESREFCDHLLRQLQSITGSAVRNEADSSCGFACKDTNRFAYFYHHKRANAGTVFFRGDQDISIPSPTHGVLVEHREKINGKWAEEYPLFMHIPLGADASAIAQVLTDYSLPLADPKRPGRKRNTAKQPASIVGVEGKASLVLSTRYERNSSLRRICLAHHGYRCKACDVLLSEVYGELADEFIHVHHVNPVANSGGEVRVNPITEMVPLCPNCHAIVHLSDKALTIAQMRALISQESS